VADAIRVGGAGPEPHLAVDGLPSSSTSSTPWPSRPTRSPASRPPGSHPGARGPQAGGPGHEQPRRGRGAVHRLRHGEEPRAQHPGEAPAPLPHGGRRLRRAGEDPRHQLALGGSAPRGPPGRRGGAFGARTLHLLPAKLCLAALGRRRRRRRATPRIVPPVTVRPRRSQPSGRNERRQRVVAGRDVAAIRPSVRSGAGASARPSRRPCHFGDQAQPPR